MKKYSRIFGYLRHDKGQIALYVLSIVLSVVFSIVSIGMLMPFLELIFKGGEASSFIKTTTNPAIKWLNQTMLDFRNKNGVDGLLAFVCGLIIVSIFFKNLFLYLSYYILNPLKNRMVTRLRSEMYGQILRLPIGYFTEKRKGDLMSRMSNDIGEIEGSVVGTLEGWFRDPLTIVFNLGILFYISPQLTLFILLCIPVMGLVIGRISKSLKKHSQEVAQKHGETFSVMDETLGGLRVIKAFNIEKMLFGRFQGANEDLLQAKNRIGYRRDLASPMSEMLGVLFFCIILWYGGQLVLGKRINLEASVFLGYMAMFYNIINPAKSLSTSFSNMQKGAAAIARIEEVLQAPVTVDENPNGKKLESFNHSIEFRNVSFYYDETAILKNINLVIEKGKTIALVGSSGAGKSTLADMVPRFHDVSSGELLIDGVNIRDYSLHSVRSQISIVTQEPILFNDTISANIRMGNLLATQAEVEEAARIANAHQFIIKKEQGYETNIGDRGTKLSGGERQRMTIARAVLKNPPILILDEATSSLDTESERQVQDAINNMMQHRTSIVIAHRLSTIRHADEIIVLQKGEIAERGTHDELMALNGFY
ncbi:MAG: ABC transporter ATP-binding protein, partial [Dinghuibacter sp.]|nr:ABC transporter ATP-binding protein [Dinghuibacter sp.]